MIGLNYRWISGLAGALGLLFGGCSGDDSTGGAGTGSSAGATAATSSEDVGTDSSDSTSVTDSGSTSASESASGTSPASGSTSGGSTAETSNGGDFDCFDPDSDECCEAAYEWPSELRAQEVTLDVTINGALHRGSAYDDADVYLVNAETEDRAYMGRVSEGKLSGYVLEGVYSISYEARPGAFTVPANAQAMVGPTVVVAGPSEEAIPVDVLSFEVELDLTVAGEAPSKSAYDDGRISVLRDGGEVRTELGKTSQMANGKLKVQLLEGDYDIFYAAEDRGLTMPHNTLARIGKGVPVDAEQKTLAIDVPVVMVSGAIDFDGNAPPNSPFDHGHIYLRDLDTEAVTPIADTMEGAITSVPVVAGTTYDLFYAADTVGVAAPANRWGKLNTAAILGEDKALTGEDLQALEGLSLPMMSVEGVVTVDGEAKPVDPENRGELLIGSGGGDRGFLGDVSVGIKSNLLRADYDVFFRHDISDGGLPANTFGQVSGESVHADAMEPLAIDVKTTMLEGQIKIGGATPPLSVYDDGEIYLRNAAGDRVFLGRTRAGEYSRRVVEGTYDVYYAVVNSQGKVPANGETRIQEGVLVEGPTKDLEIDVDVIDIGYGALPSILGGTGGKARFFLRNTETRDEVFLGKAGEEASARVIPGKYELIYRVENLGVGTPRNDGAVLGCYQ